MKIPAEVVKELAINDFLIVFVSFMYPTPFTSHISTLFVYIVLPLVYLLDHAIPPQTLN